MPSITPTPPQPIPPRLDAPVLTIDQADLAQRLAHATTEDTCKGMFCAGLYMCVERERGEAGLSVLRELANPKRFVAFFNYPIVEFLPLAWKAAELVSGAATPDALATGIRTLGRQATEDFLATGVGKTLLMLAGGDPRRLMNSLATGYKTAVSYGQRQITWRTPTHGTFSMRGDFLPHPYHEGIIHQVLTAVGATQVRVSGTRTSLLDADYDISWS